MGLRPLTPLTPLTPSPAIPPTPEEGDTMYLCFTFLGKQNP